jgi:RimJ/RimL family protein N-acetyltransferase
MNIHLTTDRLVIREFTEDDLGFLMELNGDPEVMRFLSTDPPVEEQHREWIGRYMEGYSKHPGFGYFVAEEHGLPIGWFHFRQDRVNSEDIEIGYRLKRSAWGRGLATEGSKALIAKGIAAGVKSISGRAAKANVASVRVLEKVGLKLVEEYQEPHIPGDDKSAVLMRLRVD